MDQEILQKTHTGISSEFFVAGELARRGYNVTMTFGNTKSIDLIVERETKPVLVQVKGIQRTKSLCWNLSMAKVREDVVYVFVNLHADTFETPEYFVLTGKEVKEVLKPVASGRDYIDYKVMKGLTFQDKWSTLN